MEKQPSFPDGGGRQGFEVFPAHVLDRICIDPFTRCSPCLTLTPSAFLILAAELEIAPSTSLKFRPRLVLGVSSEMQLRQAGGTGFPGAAQF